MNLKTMILNLTVNQENLKSILKWQTPKSIQFSPDDFGSCRKGHRNLWHKDVGTNILEFPFQMLDIFILLKVFICACLICAVLSFQAKRFIQISKTNQKNYL